MFTKIQKSIVIPKYLHDNEDFIFEYKINENSLDLKSYGYNDNMTKKLNRNCK